MLRMALRIRPIITITLRAQPVKGHSPCPVFCPSAKNVPYEHGSRKMGEQTLPLPSFPHVFRGWRHTTPPRRSQQKQTDQFAAYSFSPTRATKILTTLQPRVWPSFVAPGDHGDGVKRRVGGTSRSEVEPTNRRGGFRPRAIASNPNNSPQRNEE